jgi:outer membrane protein
MKRIILVLVLAFGTFSGILAQTAEVKPTMGLSECVDIALKNNLLVRRSMYGVQSANIDFLQAKMAFLPTLNAGGALGFNFGRAINPVDNTFVNRNSNTLNGQMNGSWLLFNGLRVQNSFRQNQTNYHAANEDLEKAKNDVILNVVTLYINVIFNKELLDNTNYQLSSSQQTLQRINAQVAAGALPKADQLNQEAQVATNEVNVINQENSLNLSLLQLKQAMQVPASTPMDVIIPELQLEDIVLEQTPQEVYAMALKTMPEIRSAVMRVEAAQFGLQAAKGNLYPRLSFNASAASNYSSLNRDRPVTQEQAVPVGYFIIPPGLPGAGSQYPVLSEVNVPTGEVNTYNQSRQLRDNLFKTASLQLNIPIFNGLQARSNVQRAAVQSDIARISEIEVQNQLRQSIETAYNDAVASSKTYAASLKSVSAREEAYRMNTQRFELGAVSFIEQQIAENELFRSRSDLTRAKYNFIFKKKILDFYQGKKIDY